MKPTNGAQNSTGLIAVLLITRSRPGPKLVFHYPSTPGVAAANIPSNGGEDSDFDSDAEEPELDMLGHQRNAVGQSTGKFESGDGKVPEPVDGKVLGYSVDSLEKHLSPGRWCDRKKFEICLDGTTFVGHPVYAREDGEWSASQAGTTANPARRQSVIDRAITTVPDLPPIDEGETLAGRTANITITEPDTPAGPPGVQHDFTHIPESLDSQIGGHSLGTSMNSVSTASGVVAEQLQMFHVVFALRSAATTEAVQVYEQVAKKLSKAFHHCQKTSNYVAVESRKILAAKVKAKQVGVDSEATSNQAINASELAWALKEVYERISVDEVAGIRLGGMELSLQIPLAQPEDDSTAVQLRPHSGMLLLEDKEVLLRELHHPDASPLAYFIREHTPTKSLEKQAMNLRMPIDDVRYLADHLIKWRKAKAIAPLHPRNTYVVRPDAPIEKVAELSQIYARKFAALPSLPQMLRVLSGKPIRYGVMIPSKDHRAPYMDILAFLDRHGFVAQLRTFGWLKSDDTAETKMEETKRPLSVMSLLSPHLRPALDDDAVSVSSERTAVTTVPANQDSSNHFEEDALEVDSHKLIFNPSEPTDARAASMGRVRARLSDGELKDVFYRLARYFNGEHALEEIAAKEGWKRARVEEWLDLLEKRGVLTTYRAL